ncbi:hypothetical protein EC844_10553 [Acinetobacter calcoaceticus]|uniref:Uncharacterized protein n=1 Tax=Acinetobacter calcoaceticus TaxID=471 RepID=A0A4R1Y062_ACICA|nr:hypothetical protein EC844_10553 [Acinetobacter calcoaceticus]
MGSKRMYKILKQWFPALSQQHIPEKRQRVEYDIFLNWLQLNTAQHVMANYLMRLDQQHHLNNGLEQSALLKHYAIDTQVTQRKITQRSTPLCQHYAEFKEVMGIHCNLQAQLYEIVLDEIFQLLQSLDHELLLIYSNEYQWMAVPNNQELIDEFCYLFEKHFKHLDLNIEHYQPQNGSWSI